MQSLSRGATIAAVAILSLVAEARSEGVASVESDVPIRVETDWSEPPVRLEHAGGVIDRGAEWGHASPWIVDVDSDGLRDLVVGDFSGYFNLFRNTATNQQPRYLEGVKLQAGGVDAHVPIY